MKVRPLKNWVRYTRDHYLESMELLEADKKLQGRDDLAYIAAASAVTYALLCESHVQEEEIIKHVYHAHGKKRPGR